ncbi:phosphoribosylformylglycinamidine synthase subunit PurS [Pontibacter sp. SGAir0037]|uniref:phosphoribosylformylglycinamidine synthase subunit PurS n=1 Tax=Pontibacter sp. SGAir0037 TaxID=2571030 RepID=UPI0010CD13FD|nr:phosphoribosylformylglycinamidine synthase subunit PurS [Pontibacter sp. SGAir0037]QCR24398.1 phosphoribosylformylglycinamidine synthase [Pontibacter sp. SGAir0037]
MIFTAATDMMLRPELVDLQRKAVLPGLGHLGLNQADDVRIGKLSNMQLEAENEEISRDKISNKLLANLIMESFTYELRQR